MRLQKGAVAGIATFSSILNAGSVLADIRTDIDGPNNEGEQHGDIDPPKGSIFTSLPVGGGGAEIAAYWSEDTNNSTAKRVFIMLHGKLRDGDTYWKTMHDILEDAIDADYPGAGNDTIIVAPQFFSKKYNSGQYTKHMLAWDDTNAWQAGDQAIHPSSTTETSFDALDAFVDEFGDNDKYPALENITFVGHGGGAQLNQRYATVAKDTSAAAAHVRYIHGDPSSCAYFTRNRPQSMSSGEELPSRDDCEFYNAWRYGFDNFNGTDDGLKTAYEYFHQYISRDVVSIVGYQDTSSNGDNFCMAMMQGGSKRRDRNLAWWQYINLLARTDEDLSGFPATFGDLPDWSLESGEMSVRLTVVEDAAHDAREVFSSDEGRAALFAKEVPKGWRPEEQREGFIDSDG